MSALSSPTSSGFFNEETVNGVGRDMLEHVAIDLNAVNSDVDECVGVLSQLLQANII